MRLGGPSCFVSILVVAVGVLSCETRPFWQCTDPEQVLRALSPPPDGWPLGGSGPGLFDSRCRSIADHSYASNADEWKIAVGVGENLERMGFVRVPAVPDATHWCERLGRFHQFVKDDTVVRYVVEPLPFKYAPGKVLARLEARFALHVVARNFEPSLRIDCSAQR